MKIPPLGWESQCPLVKVRNDTLTFSLRTTHLKRQHIRVIKIHFLQQFNKRDFSKLKKIVRHSLKDSVSKTTKSFSHFSMSSCSRGLSEGKSTPRLIFLCGGSSKCSSQRNFFQELHHIPLEELWFSFGHNKTGIVNCDENIVLLFVIPITIDNTT